MECYNISDLPHEQLSSLKTGEVFSCSAILSKLFTFEKLFVHHEILSPGKRASSPHHHTLQEEMIFILEGFPMAHHGKETLNLKPGDCVGFKPNSKDLHFVENNTSREVRFLVICSKPEDDQIIY